MLTAAENSRRNRLSSANSSFSSYAGDEDERNESWLNENQSEPITKPTTGTFDDKYEFLDHTILGEVRVLK